MTDNARSNTRQPSRWRYVARRLVFTLIALGVVCGGYIVFFRLVYRESSGVDVMIGASVLFGLPFALGAIVAFLTAPNGRVKDGHYTISTIGLTGISLVIGGLVLREGVICMVLLLPIWWFTALGGALTVKHWHRNFQERHPTSMSILALPFVLLVLDPYLPKSIHSFTVNRVITIDAPIEAVWPHLLEMPDIGPDEGRFTFAQSLMGIPRPSAAIVVGEGPGAIREARWGEDIYFEEHIDVWRTHDRLEWAFAFPDDSVSRYTDRHITVDGPNLYIDRGGYQLERLPDGRTKLTLFTQYRSNTPVNHYSAVWGEIFLGGIQMNVLDIVRDRSEALHSDGTGGSE